MLARVGSFFASNNGTSSLLITVLVILAIIAVAIYIVRR